MEQLSRPLKFRSSASQRSASARDDAALGNRFRDGPPPHEGCLSLRTVDLKHDRRCGMHMARR